MKVTTLLSVASCLSIVAGGRDNTCDPDAVGGDVVRAVISVVGELVDVRYLSNNDTEFTLNIARFMREMAFVESEDGYQESEQLSNDDPGMSTGGIWRISQNIADFTTQFVESDSTLSSLIQQHHCWNIVQPDLSKPLNSGLAVRIYLLHLYQMNLTLGSFTDAEKASYWAQHFKNGANTTTWTDQVNVLRERIDVCRVNTDVVFALDSSGSIENDYMTMLQYVSNFTAGLVMANQSNSRVGVIVYSDTATIAINLTSSSYELSERIENLSHIGGGTNIPDALCLLQDMNWRTNISVLRIAIVITDGQSRGTTSRCTSLMGSEGTLNSTARELHHHDPHITVSVVGVNNNHIDDDQLRIIAGGETGFYDLLDSLNYRVLEQNANFRSYFICYEEVQPAQIAEGTMYGTLSNRSILRLNMIGVLKDHQAVTIRICVLQGIIAVFGSFMYSNPNSALNDFEARLGENFPCITINTTLSGGGSRRKRQTDSQTSVPIYITLVGASEIESEFSIDSAYGHVEYDIDECDRDPDLCGTNAMCHNTDGSFFCECVEGYEGQDGFNCTDIDECATPDEACDGNATCYNTTGSFYCVCNEGYEGDGLSYCSDVDECKSADLCEENADCYNLAGSYYCECKNGFVGTARQDYLRNGKFCIKGFHPLAFPVVIGTVAFLFSITAVINVIVCICVPYTRKKGCYQVKRNRVMKKLTLSYI